jgi:uroporphyrinogen decarboxylase
LSLKIEPDFHRLRTALFCGQPDRVPLVELFVDPAVREAFLGRPAMDLRSEIEFYLRAGYDAIKISPRVNINPGHREPKESWRTSSELEFNRDRVWAPEGAGMITTDEELDSYRWPKPEEIDYSRFHEAARWLPAGMSIIGQYGDIFTWAWTLMGFETFSFALIDRPRLVERVMNILGELITGMFVAMADLPRVEALWYTDDVAFKTGLLVSPRVLRQHLFPWMKKIGQICARKNIPFMYHSDGKLDAVMEDLLGCGINALHPIEPQAMDIRRMKKEYGKRLCLIGNLDLEYTLTRGSPQEVAQKTRALIRDVGPGGGYCVSSSNSIPSYVPGDNYRAMVETVLQHGSYPLK